MGIVREGEGQALAGARTGRAIEPRRCEVWGAASGAQDDSLGRARGDGWDAAGGPVPRAETRVPCLFKQLILSRGEHVAWEDPRPRGTCLVAPRPPAYSLRAPPFEKREVSAHPGRYGRSAKPASSGALRGLVMEPHTIAYSFSAFGFRFSVFGFRARSSSAGTPRGPGSRRSSPARGGCSRRGSRRRARSRRRSTPIAPGRRSCRAVRGA